MTISRDRLETVAGRSVSRETFDALAAFVELFLRWNARINLVAPSTVADVWERHVLDSAQVLRFLASSDRRFVDFGSGGGFPGAVLAILLREQESVRITLIESNRKKAAFLLSALDAAGCWAEICAERIEAIVPAERAPDIVTARAFAPLSTILSLAEPWWAQGTRAVLHKGREYVREVHEADSVWTFDLIEHPSMTEPGAALLELSNVRRRI